MTTKTSRNYFRQPTQDEQTLYEHLLFCVNLEPPTKVLERFRRLFIDGIGYREQQIWLAVENIILSKQIEQEFPYIINRCCHILINHWQMHPQMQESIPELVTLLENPPTPKIVVSRIGRRLRVLINAFSQTEEFLTLRRLAQVITPTVEDKSDDSKPLGNLINRYPYLYEHCLLSEDSSYEHQQVVRKIKAQMQRRFEFNLSQFVTYQVRQAQTRRKSGTQGIPRMLQAVPNPTLLSDRELGIALKHFVGKVEGNYSYRDLAHRFISHASQVQSFKVFKDDFYEYLTSGVNPGYGKRQFNDKLYGYLKNIQPNNDYQKPNELMIVRSCSQVLNHLIVESPQKPNHFVFVDLISNIGSTFTTGLLLKIVLICGKIKPYLEKRFAILFKHYESFSRDGVPWLVNILENVNVAFSIHFGKADVSWLQQIM
ncbi:hypothetical protein Cri9333_1208 [Crinalium epipsammum PCC 9333]|uniref:Uncharacterized protein n=1 Tax=Crinalium epipsammum PCC 9333 TaxID=1173022 RepID=K9VX32_9CYAN|nr:hypothetical protein [Crinalium epipsammum]AFZ12109.1 hypothetical protein Cri9333_1208 [Crinalium epipsammum PCC 9333]